MVGTDLHNSIGDGCLGCKYSRYIDIRGQLASLSAKIIHRVEIYKLYLVKDFPS